MQGYQIKANSRFINLEISIRTVVCMDVFEKSPKIPNSDKKPPAISSKDRSSLFNTAKPSMVNVYFPCKIHSLISQRGLKPGLCILLVIILYMQISSPMLPIKNTWEINIIFQIYTYYAS